MKAIVTVMLKPGVLDPQGKAIGHALATLGFSGVGEVRAGKVIELDLKESDPARAHAQAEEMARRLLANAVIESFRVDIGLEFVKECPLHANALSKIRDLQGAFLHRFDFFHKL